MGGTGNIQANQLNGKKREWVWLNGEEKLEEKKSVELAVWFALAWRQITLHSDCAESLLWFSEVVR